MKPHEFSRFILTAAMLASGWCLPSCSSTTEPDDGTAPTPVTDLAVSATTATTVTLTWTATGDDKDEGTATRYDLRRSDVWIAPLTWDPATPVPGLPAPRPAGATETFTVTGLDEDATYYFALQVYDEEDNCGGVGNCAEAICFDEAVIDVPDANLAAAIRDQLLLPTGPLHRSELRPLLELDAAERGIVDLTGLEECRNLIFLRLHGNEISDLTPLAGMTRLYDLSLAMNDIDDISPLAGMADLAHLWADDNRIADLTPLAGLDSLATLRLSGNLVTDLGPLVANDGLGSGDQVLIRQNPLSETALNVQIPALEARGVTVEYLDQGSGPMGGR